MSEITPTEAVATALAIDGGGFHDDELNGWVTFKADRSTVQVEVAHHDDDGEEVADRARHFRAVVVEGEQPPIVMDRAVFEQRVNEKFDAAIRKIGYESLTFMPATIAALREQILNLDVDLAEAAQAEQERQP